MAASLTTQYWRPCFSVLRVDFTHLLTISIPSVSHSMFGVMSDRYLIIISIIHTVAFLIVLCNCISRIICCLSFSYSLNLGYWCGLGYLPLLCNTFRHLESSGEGNRSLTVLLMCSWSSCCMLLMNGHPTCCGISHSLRWMLINRTNVWLLMNLRWGRRMLWRQLAAGDNWTPRIPRRGCSGSSRLQHLWVTFYQLDKHVSFITFVVLLFNQQEYVGLSYRLWRLVLTLLRLLLGVP